MEPVLVTFDASGHQREAIEHGLDGAGEPVFLPDLAGTDRADAIRRAVVLLSMSWNRELDQDERAMTGSVRLVQFVSAGLDHVRFDDIPPGVAVAGNSGAYAGPMAEHALAMAMALAKRLPQRHAALRAGDFDQRSRGLRVLGMSCGVVGFGGIGKAVARLFRAVGFRILAINSSGRTEEPVEFCGTLTALDRVLRDAGALVLSLPLTNRTRGLIGRRELDLMRPNAILVNLARGALVDGDALFEHLERNPEFTAGLDAWWVEPSGNERFELRRPFLDLPNVLGSPHNSAIVPGALTDAIGAAARNVARFLRGEEIVGLADRADYT